MDSRIAMYHRVLAVPVATLWVSGVIVALLAFILVRYSRWAAIASIPLVLLFAFARLEPLADPVIRGWLDARGRSASLLAAVATSAMMVAAPIGAWMIRLRKTRQCSNPP